MGFAWWSTWKNTCASCRLWKCCGRAIMNQCCSRILWGWRGLKWISHVDFIEHSPSRRRFCVWARALEGDAIIQANQRIKDSLTFCDIFLTLYRYRKKIGPWAR
jgi:hypothetical protein